MLALLCEGSTCRYDSHVLLILTTETERAELPYIAASTFRYGIVSYHMICMYVSDVSDVSVSVN